MSIEKEVSNEGKESVTRSHTLYPSMMQNTKLLIFDYDVTRYHSFDLFRYCLLQKEFFYHIKEEFIPMIKEKEFLKQLLFYHHHSDQLNPLKNFNLDLPNTTTYLEDQLNTMFLDKAAKITPTNIGEQFDTVFHRNDIKGFHLRYKNDPYASPFKNVIRVYQSDHILDLAMLMEIIKYEKINAILLSSVALAINICMLLKETPYNHPISFIIANYRYNYTQYKTFLYPEELDLLEVTYKHEFGIFDPFTGLAQYEKEILPYESHSNPE